MATIRDVALRAGVSVKTVSRVLNEHESVRGKTRERVRQAMQLLGYQPNVAARHLRAQGSYSVGVLMGDPSSGYQSRFHHALLSACMETGRHLAVELFEEPDRGWQDRIAAYLAGSGVREMILLPPLCDFAPLKQVLREHGVRCVLISPSSPDPLSPAVEMDDRAAAREIVEHLFNLGHERIGHIAGHPDHAASILRRNGYFEAYAARGLGRPGPDLMAAGDFRFKSGLDAAKALLDAPKPPTAIFAANDEMAAATLMEAQRRGLRIPTDLSVVGFDDAPIASAIWPTLTTIRQPFEEMSLRAMQAFANWPVQGQGHAPSYLAGHRLIVRESSGPAPEPAS